MRAWGARHPLPCPPGGLVSERGLLMNTSVMFLDCPAYLDQRGAARCGLPAEVEYRYTVGSCDGPVESAKIRCPRGHWFNGPIASLALERQGAQARAFEPGSQRVHRHAS
jgi:hypothetical protein